MTLAEAPKRILVADDSETILLLMRTRLEMEGYDVMTAANGQEAVDAVRAMGEEGPHMILLDAMMPHKSGLDALKELRSDGLKTPILIVSAHREEEALTEAVEFGADACVPKPIDFDDLLTQIAELTEK